MLSDEDRKKIYDSLIDSATSQVDIIMNAYDKLYDALPDMLSLDKKLEIVNKIMNDVSDITLKSYAAVGDNLTKKLQDKDYMQSILQGV